MKIFAICLVKNEADVISLSLKRHCEWAEKIFVYDNGSTDNTWEIVNKLATQNNKIVPFKKEAKPFSDGLRSEVFEAYRHLASDGDWWCVRCDADEFYIDNPLDVLPKVPFYYQAVSSLHFEYELEECEIETIDFDANIESVLQEIKYYNKKSTSEVRFIRHREKLNWPTDYGFPRRFGVISPMKIRLKHYQYRSPNQIQLRIETRKQPEPKGILFSKRTMLQHGKQL